MKKIDSSLRNAWKRTVIKYSVHFVVFIVAYLTYRLIIRHKVFDTTTILITLISGIVFVIASYLFDKHYANVKKE
jgi:positive regulator of sigma E activity